MKMLVTGGAGFIGTNFIYYMKKHHPEEEILYMDKLTYAGNLENLAEIMADKDAKFRFVQGDIADRDFIYRLFEEEKPDVVVNFAAETHVNALGSGTGGVPSDECERSGRAVRCLPEIRYQQIPSGIHGRGVWRSAA